MKESYFFTKKFLIGSILLFLISLVIFIILICRYFKKKNSFPQVVKYYKCKEKQNSLLISDIFKDYNINQTGKFYCNLYLPCGYNEVESELRNLTVSNNIKYIFGLNGCDRLVSKNSLWSIFDNYYGRNISSKILPETFILGNNNDFNYLIDLYSKNNNLIMICKKNIQRKKGIKIVKSIEDIIYCKKNNYKIAQKFINNSFLVNNYKINLRVYLLIVVENGKVNYYVNREGKCLYANKKYSNNSDLVYEENITSSNMDINIYNNNPHNFEEFNRYLIQNGYNNWNKVYGNILDIFRKLYRVSSDIFKNQKHKNKIYFQLFGCDIILDDNLNPYLLEINKGPDMIPKVDKDYILKRKIYYDTFSKVNILPNKNNNFIKIN